MIVKGIKYFSEISQIDIVNFIESAWKKLVIAGSMGALLGSSYWFFSASYSAQYNLLNNTNNSFMINLVGWKTLQKNLPILAQQMSNLGLVPADKTHAFETLANKEWWEKNVNANFLFSKEDIKKYGTFGKDVEMVSGKIISFTLNMKGSNRAEAIENVKTAADFMQTGGAYLELRNIINTYAADVALGPADIQKQINSAEIELNYQIQRAKKLEEYYKRFPANNSVNINMLDLKDSSSKYLPVQVQINANNFEISQTSEALRRYHARLDQLSSLKAYLEKISPLLDKSFDGIFLSNQLKELAEITQTALAKDDLYGREMFNTIQLNLSRIQAQYRTSFFPESAPTSSRQKGMIKSIVGGLVSGLFLMLSILLALQAWRRFKGGSQK